MTSKDQASLHDVYQMLDGSETIQQTSYILQFLWRDLTSSFDIVGPYFTCGGSLASKFILACVLETLRLFQMHGFKTSVLVCDGAASNLTTIKATMGIHGAFGSCINPFNPPNKIYWIICPSHQVIPYFGWLRTAFLRDFLYNTVWQDLVHPILLPESLLVHWIAPVTIILLLHV